MASPATARRPLTLAAALARTGCPHRLPPDAPDDGDGDGDGDGAGREAALLRIACWLLARVDPRWEDAADAAIAAGGGGAAERGRARPPPGVAPGALALLLLSSSSSSAPAPSARERVEAYARVIGFEPHEVRGGAWLPELCELALVGAEIARGDAADADAALDELEGESARLMDALRANWRAVAAETCSLPHGRRTRGGALPRAPSVAELERAAAAAERSAARLVERLRTIDEEAAALGSVRLGRCGDAQAAVGGALAAGAVPETDADAEEQLARVSAALAALAGSAVVFERAYDVEFRPWVRRARAATAAASAAEVGDHLSAEVLRVAALHADVFVRGVGALRGLRDAHTRITAAADLPRARAACAGTGDAEAARIAADTLTLQGARRRRLMLEARQGA